MSNTKTVEAGERTQKFTPGFALRALLGQMLSWSRTDDHINFGALTEHPETEDDCTVGDLIAPANKELGQLIADRSELLDIAKTLRAIVHSQVACVDTKYDNALRQADTIISMAEGRAQ